MFVSLKFNSTFNHPIIPLWGIESRSAVKPRSRRLPAVEPAQLENAPAGIRWR